MSPPSITARLGEGPVGRPSPDWTVIMPVKPPSLGKTRLGTTVPVRAALSRAMAVDTIEAVSRCPAVDRIIVVTEDVDVASEAASVARFVDPLLIDVHPRPGRTADGAEPALIAAVDRGAEVAGRSCHRAALLADLPSLAPRDLARALRAAIRVERGIVADATTSGTTLLTARADVEWRSSYGRHSYLRHLALGHVDLPTEPGSTLRFDVDTRRDLEAARRRGVGPRTAGVLSTAPEAAWT
ncbi:2-phospho-L-lactate guanylyltransferase [Agromyces tropicus]